jgi:hypothetical protein
VTYALRPDVLTRTQPTRCTPEAAAFPPPALRLCLVVGPPRSGTTLLAHLLAGGQGVMSLSEPFLVHAFRPDWWLQRFFCRYQKSAGLRRRRPPVRGDAERFLRFLVRMGIENAYEALLIKETYRRSGLHPNWHNEPLLGELASRSTAVVGLIRHPHDLAASSVHLFRWVTGPRGWLVRIRVPNVPTFWTSMQVVRWAADNWNAFAAWARHHRLHLLRYEDVVRGPRQALESVCRRFGIPFRESMLNHAHPRPEFAGVGDVGVLKTPRAVDRKSIGHGRELTEVQKAVVSEICRDAARDFDYAL